MISRRLVPALSWHGLRSVLRLPHLEPAVKGSARDWLVEIRSAAADAIWGPQRPHLHFFWRPPSAQ